MACPTRPGSRSTSASRARSASSSAPRCWRTRSGWRCWLTTESSRPGSQSAYGRWWPTWAMTPCRFRAYGLTVSMGLRARMRAPPPWRRAMSRSAVSKLGFPVTPGSPISTGRMSKGRTATNWIQRCRSACRSGRRRSARSSISGSGRLRSQSSVASSTAPATISSPERSGWRSRSSRVSRCR